MTKAPKEFHVFVARRARVVLDWYVRGDAVDCPETRANINADLDSIVREAMKKFRLKEISHVLRCRTEGDGNIMVRWEDPNLV